MRIVVLDHTGNLGGAELALLRLCSAIDRSQFDIRVILFANGEFRDRLEAAGVSVEVVALDSDVGGLNRYAAGQISWANLQRMARTVPFLVRLVRRVHALDPDIVQSNTLKTGLFGLLVAPAVRRPLVWYLHDRIADDYLPSALVRVIRRLARLPRAVLANSQASARTIAPRRCVVAYPGYAPEQAIDGIDRRARSTSVVVGLVGRISPTKGQLEFVRAAALVLDSHPQARFRIIGSPMFGAADYAEQVRAQVRELGIESAVEFTGFVDDPLAEIDRLALVVHASPVPEPFGQVIIEAMIRGVPVVASRAGGAVEIVEPVGQVGVPSDPLGLLVQPGDVDALASAILQVLDDPEAAYVRAQAAYASAIRRFAVSRTATVVTQVWRALVVSRGADTGDGGYRQSRRLGRRGVRHGDGVRSSPRR